jgi:hypothetical protein
MVVHNIQLTMERLALDVAEELKDSFPEEMNRTALRDIDGTRPSPRTRSRAKAERVQKFVHLTALERYERACFHAKLLPRALRMAHYILQCHLADLAVSTLEVRDSGPEMGLVYPTLCIAPFILQYQLAASLKVSVRSTALAAVFTFSLELAIS